VTALADTGATLSVIQPRFSHQLGISTLRRISLVLADGRRLTGTSARRQWP